MTELGPPMPPTAPPSGALGFRSVLHVNEKGGRFGGTEEYLAVLTAELGRRGASSHLACGVLGDGLPPGLATTHLVEGLARREGAPGTAREVLAAVAEVQADVVYLHNLFDAALVEALDRLRPRPVLLWYVHDHYLTCLTELRLERDGACTRQLGRGCLDAIEEGGCVRRHAERSLGPAELAARAALLGSAARADAVVVVSRYMRDLLQAHLPGAAARVHLLPRPIRPVPLAPVPLAPVPLAPALSSSAPSLSSPPSLTLATAPSATVPLPPAPAGGPPGQERRPGDPTVVAFAGRITPEKGLDVVLESLARTSGTGPLELRIAGVVEHHAHWARCEELARAACEANPELAVRYLGHLGYEEVDELFAQTDVVLVPSRWPEPLGAVTGEALARGAAVAASDVGGLETFVEHEVTGLLVPPGDVEGWADAILRLVTDPALAHRLARRGAALVARYTVGAHVDALDQLVRAARVPA